MYCPEWDLVIEYDGYYFHRGKASKLREERKNNYFKSEGIILVRVKETKTKGVYKCAKTEWGVLINCSYSQDYEFVKKVLEDVLNVVSKRNGYTTKLDIDIARDKAKIISRYAIEKDEKSFVAQKPLGARKWDAEKNGDINLSLLPKTSKKKYWWKCPTCGNSWYGPLDNITNSLTCNKCSRQVHSGAQPCPETNMESALFRELEVSLASENPELAAQWHPTKNGLFKPEHVTPKSGKAVYWRCPECGYEWVQIIKTRNKGNGARKCPICANNQKKTKNNPVMSFSATLKKEFDAEKNFPAKLDDFTPGSNVAVWWKCSKCGRSYQAPIKTRKYDGGCPGCALVARAVAKYKKVQAVESGQIFESVMVAARHVGVSRSSISSCLNGKTKTAGGYHWIYRKNNRCKKSHIGG